VTAVAGFLLLVIRGRRRRLIVGKAVSLGLASFSMFLLPQVGSGPSVSVTWIPGGGAIGLDLGAPGIYLAIGVFWTLALTLATISERSPPSPPSSYWPGLAFLFCSLVVLALTLNHFLARYIVLELVVLCAILTFLVEIPLLRDGFPVWRRYLCFRLGDAGLILAILLLWHFAGTFDIRTMLARGLALPSGQRGLVVLGGLLTVWIKVGLPPFHGWLLDSSALSWGKQTWLAGIALPTLGAYLLYRLDPLFVAPSALRAAVAAAGVVIVLWLGLRGSSSHLSEGGSRWLMGHGAVALILVGTPFMNAYLLTFIPVRLGICFLAIHRRGSGARLVSQTWTGQSDPYGWVLSLANWAGRFERRGLEAVNRGLVAAVMRLSRMDAYLVEHKVLEGINRWVARASWHTGQTLRAGHTGRIRRNLLWASSGLAVLIAVALLALAD